MIFVSHTQSGETPGILEIRIQRKAIVFDRQRSAVTEDLHGAREIVAQGIFEALAPARRSGWQTTRRKTNGGQVKTRIEAAAPVETYLLRIQFVKVVEDTAD